MPSLDVNRRVWATYDWEKKGDEWSHAWGSPSAEWYGTILPRLYPWLPTGTLLEIAPGFGRWTQFLKDVADHLILVDLTERCISACRARFARASNITYHVNDGRSLSMIPDGTIDLAFSFDSLVHVEADVLGAYLAELARKLSPDGIGFIHHSNLGAYPARLERSRSLVRLCPILERFNPALARVGITAINAHWRAESVTALGFAALCLREGLQCRSQELFPWGSNLLTDCISVFTRPESRWARTNQVLVSRNFMVEAARGAARYRLYET
jgi:SAM-dependent methyltransferase